MSRLIIISNRAPISVIKEQNSYTFKKSSGGLASGLGAYLDQVKRTNAAKQVVWIGWPGREVEDEKKVGAEILKKFGVQSVFLTETVMQNFYEGFCNKTIWPLFHYFPVYAIYKKEFWDEYNIVNKKFCDAVLQIYKKGDVLWVHDYHLMLLPEMIRREVPDATIGFFLHIPFPAYEVYRLIPSQWRRRILEGLFGADLIGFHTFDYRTYFLRSTLNILGLTQYMGEVVYNNRLVKVDSFPMGIDYAKYHSGALAESAEKEELKSKKRSTSEKLILSIDRQDYSKGILNRLKAYEHFLETNKEWRKKVTLMLVVVPSRIGVERYKYIKRQIDELVGHINGKYGNLEWIPIHYQYRSLSFNELIALYNYCDVALVTPLRDGMNLIAKEFIASRTNKKGVLILSEMTGAAQELGEAIIINPNNIEEISQAMLAALEMDSKEQERRLNIMQERVKVYDVFKWASNFLGDLDKVKQKQKRLEAQTLNADIVKRMVSDYSRSSSRFIFLDYDGTLVEHASHPDLAQPDEELYSLLKKLSARKNVTVVVISGRSKTVLDKWFGNLPIDLVAEHGVFVKEKNKTWHLLKPVLKSWKKKIIAVMKSFAEKLPGALIEEKEFSVAFHYRKCEPALALLRVRELTNHLMNFTSNMNVQLVHGSKTLEVRNAGIDKGIAALHCLSKNKEQNPFIIAIGNDQTDEDIFRAMPSNAFTIKVGTTPSYARFNLNNPTEVRDLLTRFIS